MWEGSCDGCSYVGCWDGSEDICWVLATAPEKVLATGLLSNFDRVLALAPARVPEMDRVLACLRGLVMSSGRFLRWIESVMALGKAVAKDHPTGWMQESEIFLMRLCRQS